MLACYLCSHNSFMSSLSTTATIALWDDYNPIFCATIWSSYKISPGVVKLYLCRTLIQRWWVGIIKRPAVLIISRATDEDFFRHAQGPPPQTIIRFIFFHPCSLSQTRTLVNFNDNYCYICKATLISCSPTSMSLKHLPCLTESQLNICSCSEPVQLATI